MSAVGMKKVVGAMSTVEMGEHGGDDEGAGDHEHSGDNKDSGDNKVVGTDV